MQDIQTASYTPLSDVSPVSTAHGPSLSVAKLLCRVPQPRILCQIHGGGRSDDGVPDTHVLQVPVATHWSNGTGARCFPSRACGNQSNRRTARYTHGVLSLVLPSLVRHGEHHDDRELEQEEDGRPRTTKTHRARRVSLRFVLCTEQPSRDPWARDEVVGVAAYSGIRRRTLVSRQRRL